MMIPFGRWAPDAIATTPGASPHISGVLPDDVPGSYGPAPSFVPTMPPLAEPCLGGFMARSGADGVPVLGTATKLYAVTSAVIDASKAGGYALGAGERWSFTQYKKQVIATAIDAPTQAITLGGVAFADLVTGTRKPRARASAVIAREWLVLGNTRDSIDGDQINRVWWSHAGSIENFDPDDQFFGGYQDLDASGGGVVAITGVEYATVLMRHDIWRMSPDTSIPNGFRFDKLDPGNGALSGGAVAALGRSVFYLSESGPMVFDGTKSTPIGIGWSGWIDRNLNRAATSAICALIDHKRSLVWWFLPTGSDSLPNTAIVYNHVSGQAAPVDVAVDVAFSSSSGASYIDSDATFGDESPMGDELIDSATFGGGGGVIHAVDRRHAFGVLDGAPAMATLETAEIALDGRAFCESLRPLITDCAARPLVSVRYRDDATNAALTASPPREPGMDGRVYPFVHAGHMRFRVEIDGAFHRAVGVDATLMASGGI